MSTLTFAQECWESPEDEAEESDFAAALHDAISELEMAQRMYARGEVTKAKAAIREALALLEACK